MAMAATEAKEPLGPCGQNLLSMTLWQFENSHMCSQSQQGYSVGSRGERGSCVMQIMVPGAEEGQDAVEFSLRAELGALCSGPGSQDRTLLEQKPGRVT